LRITSARNDGARGAGRSAIGVAILMAVQAVLGLLFRAEYLDVEWVAATWLGNDMVTLVVAVPLLVAATRSVARGYEKGRVVVAGALAYGVYNYAYYLFGAALNVFFPIYVLALLCSAWALIGTIAAIEISRVQTLGRRSSRVIGSYFVAVGAGLTMVWVGIWAAYVFFGRTTPVEPEAFKLIAALDLTLMVPLMVFSGVQLWRRRLNGYLVGSVAGVQASLYLTVLSVNSVLAVRNGLVEAPGELPVWGTLALLTVAATLLLVQPGRREML
jgi:hypothetical protein